MKQRVITEYKAFDFNQSLNNAISMGWHIKSICCNDFSWTAVLEKQT